uniref:ADP-ribose pyrophosphatase, mitochondrial n=1 Tax=Cacopsylla melanoneura TaxID=428564 RepID=A0A8D8TB01_9HEMI
MTNTRGFLSIIFLAFFLHVNWAISVFDAPFRRESREELFDDVYPQSNVTRVLVSGQRRIDWEAPMPQYNPPYFVHPSVIGAPWADTENVRDYRDKFNRLDGDLDRRRARNEKYEFEIKTGRPLNPRGRTGVCGRGLLGRWGPNHVSLLIVSRWFRDQKGEKVIMPSTGNPLLEFVAVKMHGQWGIPGGFVQEDESYMQRAQKEFMDEALNASNMTERERKLLAKHMSDGYDEHAHFISRGYIDDCRNTDNAWLEGTCSGILDKDGHFSICLDLKPGDGAEDVKWLIAHRDMTMPRNHKKFVRYMTELQFAHW